MRKVIVSASTEYAVLIGRGLLAQLGTEVAKRIRPCKAAVITDTTVEKLYAEQAEQSLAAAGFTTCRFSYPAGEGSKHIGTLSDDIYGSVCQNLRVGRIAFKCILL